MTEANSTHPGSTAKLGEGQREIASYQQGWVKGKRGLLGGRRVVAGTVDELSVDELSLVLLMSCRSMSCQPMSCWSMSYQSTPNDIRTIDVVSLLIVDGK